jgi:uncharacterized UPF0160 family protein
MTSLRKARIGTHGGQFHLDDALACFMLQKTSEFADGEVMRSVDPQLLGAQCDVVCDIGGEYDHARRRYDHHQRGYFEVFSPRTPKIKCAASGLVWRHYGLEVVRALWPQPPAGCAGPTEEAVRTVYERTYDAFIAPIDATDNGINQYPPETLCPDAEPLYRDGTSLSQRVKAMNARWNEGPVSDEETLARFTRASKMAGSELRDCIQHLALSWLPARQIVEKAFASRRTVAHPSGHVIAFAKGEACPYVSHLRDLEDEEAVKDVAMAKKVLYAIVWDNSRQQWACTAVAVRPDSFECRLAFPQEWRGLRDDDLAAKIGIPGSIFVHASGFLACNKTMEGMLAMI